MTDNIMRFLKPFIFVLLAACAAPAEHTQEVSRITADELNMMMTQSGIQLIDVRTPEETSLGIISGSVHIDFYDEQFEEKIRQLDKDAPVVLYCASGIRSARASAIFVRNEFNDIHDLKGGIRGWQAAGYEVEIPNED